MSVSPPHRHLFVRPVTSERRARLPQDARKPAFAPLPESVPSPCRPCVRIFSPLQVGLRSALPLRLLRSWISSVQRHSIHRQTRLQHQRQSAESNLCNPAAPVQCYSTTESDRRGGRYC